MHLFCVLRKERELTLIGCTLCAGTWQEFFYFVLKDQVSSQQLFENSGLEPEILSLVTISIEGKLNTVKSLSREESRVIQCQMAGEKRKMMMRGRFGVYHKTREPRSPAALRCGVQRGKRMSS